LHLAGDDSVAWLTQNRQQKKRFVIIMGYTDGRNAMCNDAQMEKAT